MITYNIHSIKTNCDFQFKYDGGGRLIGFEILTDNLTIDETARKSMFTNAPATVGHLKQYCKLHKIQLIEIKPDLSFDTFWKRYGNINGSKKKAEVIWEKMSEKNKNLAMMYIDKYRQSLGSTTQAYATTYLNGMYWVK